MDDLIVILLTLVFVVAGIFGQMKKKKSEKQGDQELETQPEEQAGDVDDFWDFLEPESQPNHARQKYDKETEQQKQPLQVMAEESAKKQPEHKFNPENEGSLIYGQDLTSDKKVKKQNKYSPRDRFSLKKAVIYSEILNRKYT